MGSTFFSSASIGSVSTVILFLTTFLPYIVVIALGTTLSRSSRFITVRERERDLMELID